MRLIETIKGAYQSVFERGKVVKIDRKPLYLTFPGYKTDFSDGEYGLNGFDLANAFVQKVIQTGDLLEIIQEDLRGRNEVHEVRRVIYLEPESALLGSRGYHRVWEEGYHRVWEEETRAGIDLPNITTQGAIIGWKKTGKMPPEELRKIIAAIESMYDEKESRLIRKSLPPKPLL